MPLFNRPILILMIQSILLAEMISGVVAQRWSVVFVALVTLILTFLPQRFARFIGIELPRSVLTAIVIFIFATLFLGEVGDIYERFWWWDVALHFMSALSFGAMGFLAMFMLFEGDRYATPAWALAVLAFCVGVSIGALWEVFEYGMDEIIGTKMQKSGLVDTMEDLIIDTFGAAIGAFGVFMSERSTVWRAWAGAGSIRAGQQASLQKVAQERLECRGFLTLRADSWGKSRCGAAWSYLGKSSLLARH